LISYPNLGLDKDPPYAYKDKTDNYDAPLNAQRVKKFFVLKITNKQLFN